MNFNFVWNIRSWRCCRPNAVKLCRVHSLNILAMPFPKAPCTKKCIGWREQAAVTNSPAARQPACSRRGVSMGNSFWCCIYEVEMFHYGLKLGLLLRDWVGILLLDKTASFCHLIFPRPNLFQLAWSELFYLNSKTNYQEGEGISQIHWSSRGQGHPYLKRLLPGWRLTGYSSRFLDQHCSRRITFSHNSKMMY